MTHLRRTLAFCLLAVVAISGCAPELGSTSAPEMSEFVSAIEVLEAQGHTFETETYVVEGEDKPFVTAVNGERQSPAQKLYWFFYVDGKALEVSPYDFPVKEGSSVEARLERWERQITATR